MNKTVIEVQVRAVLPTSGGCAVFIGNNDKVFIIYVDQTVGSAITMFMRDITKERPLTHDLMAHLMTALGAKVERVIINDLKNATYYARAIIRAENELQQKKIIELDARPSDCIAIATQQKAPIYVSQEVWDEVDDMSDVLRKMEEEGLKPDPETESEDEPSAGLPIRNAVLLRSRAAQSDRAHSTAHRFALRSPEPADCRSSISRLLHHWHRPTFCR